MRVRRARNAPRGTAERAPQRGEDAGDQPALRDANRGRDEGGDERDGGDDRQRERRLRSGQRAEARRVPVRQDVLDVLLDEESDR